MKKSSNPIYKKFKSNSAYLYETSEAASYGGVIAKTSLMFLVTIILASLGFYLSANNESLGYGLITVGMIGSLITVIAVIFTSRLGISPVVAFSYAIFEGILLGASGYFINQFYPGAVVAALLITAMIFSLLLFVYATGIFKVGRQFRKFVYTAMLAAFIFYFGIFIASIFSDSARSFMYDSNIMLILSGLFVILASFRLVIAFDDASNVVKAGAPKKAEWTVGFALLFSTIWLYVEVLEFIIRISIYIRD